jgi:hypothetical protein
MIRPMQEKEKITKSILILKLVKSSPRMLGRS